MYNFELEGEEYTAKDVVEKLKNNSAPIDIKQYTESIISTLSKGKSTNLQNHTQQIP